jgi:hypothetical protein
MDLSHSGQSRGAERRHRAAHPGLGDRSHLEHNFGHGEQNLSVVLALMMMLAFLVDQVQQLCCPLFLAAWHKMRTRCHL